MESPFSVQRLYEASGSECLKVADVVDNTCAKLSLIHILMPVKGIKCREQSRGKRKRIKRTVFAFFGHVLSDMFPKVAEHG